MGKEGQGTKEMIATYVTRLAFWSPVACAMAAAKGSFASTVRKRNKLFVAAMTGMIARRNQKVTDVKGSW